MVACGLNEDKRPNRGRLEEGGCYARKLLVDSLRSVGKTKSHIEVLYIHSTSSKILKYASNPFFVFYFILEEKFKVLIGKELLA